MTSPTQLAALLEVLSAHRVTSFTDGELHIEMLPEGMLLTEDDVDTSEPMLNLDEIQFINPDGEPVY